MGEVEVVGAADEAAVADRRETRKRSATKAADARWGVPQAEYDGEIDLGGRKLACAVLADGRRVLTQETFFAAIGRQGRPVASQRSNGEGRFEAPVFLAAANLKPFIGSTLQGASRAVVFRTKQGQRAYGYEARLLPLVCDVYLQARRAGVLTHMQEPVAAASEILVSGLAQLGIVALVDEATGYQAVRDKKALQTILDRFLLHNFADYAKRFPEEFYRHIFRLRGWAWKGMKVNRPQCVAGYTKELVYARLAPSIVDELETRNPVAANGRRKGYHHQLLTEEVGHPALAAHLNLVIGFMRYATTWDQLLKMLNAAAPKHKLSQQITLFDNEV